MKRTYLDYLKDMLENAHRGILFSQGMDYKTFIKDEKSVYAVIRAVEIIAKPLAISQKKFAQNILKFLGAMSQT